MLGNRQGRGVVLADAQRQRHRAAIDQPGVERRDDAAEIHLRGEADLVRARLGGGDRAAQRVAMAVDVFGERFDDDIRAEIERAHVVRRVEGVVHRNQNVRVRFVGQFGDGGDVRDLERRARRRLDMHQLGVGAKRRAYVLGIGGIHDGGFDAVLLRQNLVQQAVGGDIGGVGEDRVVASVEERGERGGQRGHAGSEHHRILGTFKTGQLFFQIALVRMAVARVKVHVRTGPVDVRGVVG